MKKVIALTTVLGLGALGMACGDAANTNVSVNTNRVAATPVSTMTPAVVASTPASTTNTTNSNTTGSNMNANKSSMSTANNANGIKKP